MTVPTWLKTWLHEPLVHFLLLGVLIFAIDQAVRSDDDNPRVIVVDEAVRAELVDVFEGARGREPTEEEFEVLLDTWLYNEIMYREALVLGLDKGDEMFRSRLELKLRAMLIDNVVLDPPTEEDLRAWFEANRERYTAPHRFDFVQFRVEGEEAEQRAAELAGTLVDGTIPEPYDDVARFYKNRSRDNIAAVFGIEFADGLVNGGGDAWHPLPSKAGWHVARIQAEKPPLEPNFEALRPTLEAEWRKFHNNRLAVEALNEIRATYEVRREDRP